MVRIHSPATGIINITNPTAIIFIASGPEASPKARLAIPVRAKINARIPKITPRYAIQEDSGPLDYHQRGDYRQQQNLCDYLHNDHRSLCIDSDV